MFAPTSRKTGPSLSLQSVTSLLSRAYSPLVRGLFWTSPRAPAYTLLPSLQAKFLKRRLMLLPPPASSRINDLQRRRYAVAVTKVVDGLAAAGQGVVVDDAEPTGTQFRIESPEHLNCRLVHVAVEAHERKAIDWSGRQGVLEPAFKEHDLVVEEIELPEVLFDLF